MWEEEENGPKPFLKKIEGRYPDRCFIGTENPGAGGVRGDYGIRNGKMEGDYRTAAVSHELLWKYEASREFVSGDFVWTGLTNWVKQNGPEEGAPFGAIDTAGFPKDTFYYYRSIWNNEDITLHLLPHWNFRGERRNLQTVIAYTNCQYVSLY
jgi:beta-galactosidase